MESTGFHQAHYKSTKNFLHKHLVCHISKEACQFFSPVAPRGVASPRQRKRSNHPEHGYVAWKNVRTSGVERSIIEGVDIHIFVFCVINLFWNVLFLRSVNTNIWIWTPSIIELATPLVAPYTPCWPEHPTVSHVLIIIPFYNLFAWMNN